MPRENDDDLVGIDWLESQLESPNVDPPVDQPVEPRAVEPADSPVESPGDAPAVEPSETPVADPSEIPVEPELERGPGPEPEPEPEQLPEADLEPAAWRTTPVETYLPPTEEEAATAVLDAPVPAQAALPLPVPPPLGATPDSYFPPTPDASAPAAATPATGVTAPVRRVTPLFTWIAGGLLVVIVLVGLFFLGQRLAGNSAPAAPPASSAAAAITPTPTPTPPPVITGPQTAGAHAWDELGGGECLEPYASPWEEEFTVVDCAEPHAGQLVYRGAFPADATPFPGEAALAAQINLLCTAPGVIDLAAAAAFPDLQLQGSYPVTDEQWSSGQRNFFCFASRAGGEPLTAGIAGPGPAA